MGSSSPALCCSLVDSGRPPVEKRRPRGESGHDAREAALQSTHAKCYDNLDDSASSNTPGTVVEEDDGVTDDEEDDGDADDNVEPDDDDDDDADDADEGIVPSAVAADRCK
eukprot:54366-Eustigmatos_ZCMA.PRE.1